MPLHNLENGNADEERANIAESLSPYRCNSTGSLQLIGMPEIIPPTTSDFESVYRKPAEEVTCVEAVKDYAQKKWKKYSFKHTLAKNFPTISALKHYKLREYLPNDFVAGLTAGITMIPQGMAFASLSTLPPIVGLYMSLFASLTYFVVGTCHQLSWGCVAVLAILTGDILNRYESKVSAAFPMSSTDVSTLLTSAVPYENVTDTLATSKVPYENVTDSLLSAVTGNSSTLSTPHPLLEALSTERKIEVVGAVTLISGVILALLGKLGLGRLTTFMSDSLITSFTVGASFHVASSQIRAALDLNVPRQSGIFKLVKLWVLMLRNIHHANPATIIISLICIIVLYLVKRFINEKYKSKLRVPVPIELLVVIIATVTTAYTGLSDKYSVSIVKEVPIGVPSPRVPDIALGTDYFAEGMIIIIVAFTQNVAMAKLMALKHSYRIDANQEMFACGTASIVCSLFSGFIPGPSVSRSIVQDGAGGKTQVASLFAAGLVLLVIMVIGPYFYFLPTCVLAAIILVNLRSMFLKLLTVPMLWRQSPMDGVVWVTTWAATVLLGMDLGLLAGVVVCILLVLIRSQLDTVDVMSNISAGGIHVWQAGDKYLGGVTGKGVQVVKVNSALYFANAEVMTDQVFKKTGVNPIKIKKSHTVTVRVDDDDMNRDVKVTDSHLPSSRRIALAESQGEGQGKSVREESKVSLMRNNGPGVDTTHEKCQEMPTTCVIVDLSAVTFVDVMGVQALQFLIDSYQAVDISVYFANAQHKCLNTLKRMGFLSKHKNLVFVTIDAAVEYASQQDNL